jgi:hypothetical protein
METRSEMKFFHVLRVCVLLVCLGSVSAWAKLYIMGQVTGDTTDVCPNAFTMDVQDMGNQTLFKFTNNCDNGGVVGRIFIMENDLITFNSIYDQPEGVSFSGLIKEPAMLPGGQPLGFTPHNTYSINADPARPKNGLHYQDYVSILFDLNVDGGVTFDDVIGAIDSQSLGFGIHAQSLPGGASASFVTIPEPATLMLLGIGAILVQRKKRDTAQ